MTGTVTISIELELGWGIAKYGKLDKLSDDRVAETRYLTRLLERCDDHDVPITFDVVGHLFHERCAGHHGGPHADDWWDVDPGTSVDEDPAFYAPDLIEDIRSRRAAHEICTHTYSHVECGDVDPSVVAWELDQSRRVHEKNGLPAATSIVPPRHSPPPSETLVDGGIRVKRAPHYLASGEHRPSTPVRKLAEILFERHPSIQPCEIDGVVETYSPEYTTLAVPYLQTGQYQPHPVYRPIPRAVRQRLHAWNLRRGVDAAAEGGAVHYWCHLYDLANAQQWSQIDDFLCYLATRRDNGAVEIQPMRDLPAVCDRSDPSVVEPEEQPEIVIE